MPEANPLIETALQHLYRWEKTRPSELYLTQPFGNGVVRDYTFGQVMDQSRRMAGYLQSFGWPAGSRVALLSKNCAHWMMADFAIWLAGYVSVPLYPNLAAESVRQILTHSGAVACFVGKLDEWDAMKGGIASDLPCISLPLSPQTAFPKWDDIIAKLAPLTGEPQRRPDELATIMYTSGTTGMPKGVMHSFGTFGWSISTAVRRIQLAKSERMLSYLPLAHVAERTLVEHGSIWTGCRVFFAESLDTFMVDIKRARPTIFFSVPRLWVKFQQGVQAKMPDAKLDRLLRIPIVSGIVKRKVLAGLGLDACRVASGGAAPMPVELLQWYAKLGLKITEAYGMTENCGISHSTLPDQMRPGTVGKAYDGIHVRLDPETQEIQVKSPGTMLGYYKEPELTRAALGDDGWLRTGDKGAYDGEGNLRITGRVKDLFKTSKGKYVAPAPIEDRLSSHPAIEACAVTGANLGQPLGIVMLSAVALKRIKDTAERSALEASLGEHLSTVNKALDPHEQLDCVAVVTTAWTIENGFITPTFKIKRNKIDEAYSSQFAIWLAERKPVVWVKPNPSMAS
jgi:long-chain acyl-CoA synthetase